MSLLNFLLRFPRSQKLMAYAAFAGGITTSNAATLAGFTINLNFVNAPTADEQTAFNAAKAAWESVITGYAIDDLQDNEVTINVNLAANDGVGGVLGSAGPETVKLNATMTQVSSTYLYTQTGSMSFDIADTANLQTQGLLDDVILHEMGHVLGIGTLWSSSALGLAGRQELYVNNSGQYTGAFGIAAYNDEFNQAGAFVPVELGGGSGTANGHWNEADGGGGATGIVSKYNGKDFKNELMTGWLGGETFMSNLTMQSMRDLGYTVVPEPSATLLICLSCLPLLRRKRN